MKLDFSLQMQQVQKLLMTPQLKQAIKILQMPAFELQEYIQQRIEENPVLEVVEDEPKSDVEPEPKTQEPEPIDWENYFHELNDYGEISFGKEVIEKDSFDTYTSKEITFVEYFEQQLGMLDLTTDEQKIAEYIVGSLDDSGYLKTPLSEISTNLGVDEETIEKVLKIVQQLEPGIGARDLKECLLLQIKAKDNVPEHTQEVIENYLELIADMKLPKLADILNISLVEVQGIVDYIKKLNPRPGLAFASNMDNRYIQPDVSILDFHDEYIVMVNDNTIPKLQVNNYYQSLLNTGNEEEQQYIKETLNNAYYLIKAIEQRKRTLQQVVEYIVGYQREFFKFGVKYLKPLRLKDVAESLEIHESTVSRATNGKFAETPRGIFELKYFFSGSLDSGEGEMATLGIKQLIYEMIEKEDTSKPLSDQQIADTLQEQGINISRRTVAKYRDEGNIPSSSKRKRYK